MNMTYAEIKRHAERALRDEFRLSGIRDVNAVEELLAIKLEPLATTIYHAQIQEERARARRLNGMEFAFRAHHD